jgi:hypothetical protein
MADSENDIGAAMLANALVSYYSGVRWAAADDAAERVERQPDAKGRALWTKARDLLRSPNPIPPHKGFFPEFPSAHHVAYVRVRCFADGGAVSHESGDDDGDHEVINAF